MKLIDAFLGSSGRLYGPFAALGELDSTAFPWATSQVDNDYLFNHSGGKTASPLVETMSTQPGLDPPDIAEALAQMLDARFGATWKKRYAVLAAEYNPIENYSMTQEETPNITRVETPDITNVETPNITRSGSQSQSMDVTTTGNGSNSADVYGFNSNEPVPSAESNADSSQNVKAYADDNETLTETRETGTRTHKETGTRTHTETGTRKLTRSGNIGVTTSQQMLESEIKLWEWNFLEGVFEDADKILTVPVYQL